RRQELWTELELPPPRRLRASPRGVLIDREQERSRLVQEALIITEVAFPLAGPVRQTGPTDEPAAGRFRLPSGTRTQRSRPADGTYRCVRSRCVPLAERSFPSTSGCSLPSSLKARCQFENRGRRS